ncbi:MAG: DoxX family protein [Candidatus Kryptoniota bacterium]
MEGLPAAFPIWASLRRTYFGPAVALLEFAGGLILILGLLTRWVSLLFTIEFLVAIFKVHLPQGFFIGPGPDGKSHYGFEYPLLLLLLFISLVITGGGNYSIDSIISKRNKNKD